MAGFEATTGGSDTGFVLPIDWADWQDMVIAGLAAIQARSALILVARWIEDPSDFGNRSTDGS